MKFLSNVLIKAGLIVEGTTDLQGTSTALTATLSDNSTKIATTAFVKGQGYITGESDTLDSVTDRGATTTNILTIGGLYAPGQNTLFSSETNFFYQDRVASSGTQGFKIKRYGTDVSFWRYDDATGFVEFGNPQNYGLKLYTNNAAGVYIHSDGKVSINNSVNAGYHLDVTGEIRSSSRVVAGIGGITNNCLYTYISNHCGSSGYIGFGFVNTTNPAASDSVFDIYQGPVASPIANLFNIKHSLLNASYAQAQSILGITTTINQSGTATGDIRGIYYNPTVTNVIGNHYAFESTSGKFKISDLSGTGTRMVVADSSGVLSTQAIPSGNTGTVTSVGLSLPNIFSVSGSPVTTSGTLTATLANQNANVVFAGPSTGSAAAPTFRSLVAADIPSLPYEPTLTKGNLTEATSSVLTITGGTGAVIGSGTTIQVKQSSGTVSGFLSSTDWTTFNSKEPAIAAGTTAQYWRGDKSWQDLNTAVRGAISLTTTNSSGAATYNSTTGVLNIPQYTFNGLSPMTTLGDIIYGGASGAGTRLAGNTTTTKQFLSQTGTGTVSAAPSWSAVTKSDVGLGNVENTALSTWAGSTNITTLGTITSGTWSASTIAIARGGTGATTAIAAFDALSPLTTLGDTIYHDGTDNVRLAGNTTTTRKFLRQTGTGTVSAAPAWDTLVSGDIPNNAANTTGSAATLTTARTLTIGATGKTFNGSANVSWSLAEIGAQAIFTVTSPLTYNTTTNVLNINQASSTVSGWLSFTDWNTFNGKQNAFGNQTANTVYAGPTTGSAAAPTFRSLVAADIPSLSYLPLSGGTLTGPLLSTVKNTTGALGLGSGDTNTQSNNYVQIRLGYNGNSADYPHFITTGHNSVAATGNFIKFWTSDSTLAGVFPANAVLGLTVENGKISSGQATFTVSSGTNIELNKGTGPSIQFNKTAATAQGWQLSGEETRFALYNTTATTTPFQIAASGGAATFTSTVQTDRISTGGSAAYPNVAVSIRGTIGGNTDSWGVYQNTTFTPSANDAKIVGYHAGGASSINTGTFTGLSYRGFYQQDLAGNSGTGTLATAYGIYVEGLTRGTNNYSAYFAQNVGIGATAPNNLLHIASGSGAVGGTQLTIESQANGYGAGFNSASRTSAGGTLVQMGKVVFDGEGIWNTTASTQDAYYSVWVALNGSLVQRQKIASDGIVSFGAYTTNSLLKFSGGTGTIAYAVAGTDYVAPSDLSNYVTIATAQTITESKTFSKQIAGGSGDYTNMTSFPIRITGTSGGSSDYWRIPHLSNSLTIAGVYNYETGKDVYWGEESDTGKYWFRGRSISAIFANTSTTFENKSYLRLINNAAATANQRIDIAMRFEDGTYNGTGGISMVRDSATARTARLILQPIDSAGNNVNALILYNSGNAAILGKLGLNGASPDYGLTVYNSSNGTTAAIGGTAYGLRIDNGGTYSAGMTTLFGVDNTFYGSYQPIRLSGSTVYLSIGESSYVTVTSSNLTIPENYWIKSTSTNLIRSSNFGYSTSYKVAQFGANDGTHAISLGVDLTGNASGNFSGSEIVIPNNKGVVAPNAANNDYIGVLKVTSNNGINIGGNYTVGGWINILSSGYVGINNSSPSDILDVQRNQNGTTNFYFRNTDTTNASSRAYLNVIAGTNRISLYSIHGDNNYINMASGAFYLQMNSSTSTINPIYVSTAGYVGLTNTSPQGYLDVYGAGGGSGTTSSVIIRNGNADGYFGNNQIVLGYAGTVNYAHAIKTRHQSGSAAGNAIDIYTWKYGDAISTIGGQHVLTIQATGLGIFKTSPNTSYALDVSGNVQASAYFESSDMRFKTLVEKNIEYSKIANIEAKYYMKDGREELGYFAQEFEGLFDSAVSKRDDGYLDLSYRQVHTAKIAALEKEIRELKEQLKNK